MADGGTVVGNIARVRFINAFRLGRVVPQGLKPAFFLEQATRLNSLRKKYFLCRSLTSAAKADTENAPVIAAVNRCATQNPVQHRVFPQAVKPCRTQNPICGTRSSIAGDSVLALVAIILLGVLVACSKPPQTATETPATEARQTTGLESIPEPDPTKYPPLSKMSGWRNPYLIVREDGIGFLDLSNREIHILKPEEIPAQLVSLPSSAWPYGRVVLVAQAVPKNPSTQTKAELRKNRALLLGTLKELDVQFREAP
jgi:hypothetical protein